MKRMHFECHRGRDSVRRSEEAMYEYNGIVRRVVDGDTLQLDIDLGLDIWKHNQSFRLVRINAPELGTPEGEHAKQVLQARIERQPVLVWTKKDRTDPYRRYLADVVFQGESVSDWMLKNGLAVPYP